MPWMIPSEYAKIRGVSAQRITALKSRLEPAIRPKGKRYEIDSEAADEILARTIDPSWRPQSKLKDKKSNKKPKPETAPHDPPPDQGRVVTFDDAKRLEKLAQAGLKKLDLEERQGKLLKREDVENDAFNRGRAVRDALLNIPDRIAAMLAAESDPVKITKMLDDEIRQALEELAR